MPKILQGQSLAPILRNADKYIKTKNFAYTISYGGSASTIRTDQWRYTSWTVENGENAEELYDHRADPEELINLSGHKDYVQIEKSLRDRLATIKNGSITHLENKK